MRDSQCRRPGPAGQYSMTHFLQRQASVFNDFLNQRPHNQVQCSIQSCNPFAGFINIMRFFRHDLEIRLWNDVISVLSGARCIVRTGLIDLQLHLLNPCSKRDIEFQATSSNIVQISI